MENRYVIIMAGGRGERFWPKSRLSRPKHLLSIVGDESMLSQTISRISGVVPIENVFVITNVNQEEAVRTLCPQLAAEQVVAEPFGKDTAAAVALALVIVKQRDPEGIFTVLPADHIIYDVEGFRSVLVTAFEVAEKTAGLITIGVKPTEAATGYGYIRKGIQKMAVNGTVFYKAVEFVEKPDMERAAQYLKSGEYYWNAGIFSWGVNALEKAFKEYSKPHYILVQALNQGLRNGNALRDLLAIHYPNLEKISIDYAVMERADCVFILESDFDWDDVGEWPAIARHYKPDKDGNVVCGNALIEGGSRNIIINENGHMTVLIGLDDVIVVETEDATLVCAKSRAQDIKHAVNKIAKNPDHAGLC